MGDHPTWYENNEDDHMVATNFELTKKEASRPIQSLKAWQLRSMAATFGHHLTEIMMDQLSSCMAFRTPEKQMINVYYTPGTVNVVLTHKRRDNPEFFYYNCTGQDLLNILADVRDPHIVHVRDGEYRKARQQAEVEKEITRRKKLAEAALEDARQKKSGRKRKMDKKTEADLEDARSVVEDPDDATARQMRLMPEKVRYEREINKLQALIKNYKKHMVHLQGGTRVKKSDRSCTIL
jgi:hypothetical protein